MRRVSLTRRAAGLAVAAALMVAALLPFADSLAAQAPAAAAATATLAPGTRVRVDLPLGRASGTVQQVHADTLVLAGADSQPLAIARGDVRRMWVSEGRRTTTSGMWRGVRMGLLLGGLTGAALGYADGDDESGILALSAAEKATIGLVFMGGGGAVVGGILGATMPGERWTRVDGRAIAVRPTPRGGVTLALSRTF